MDRFTEVFLAYQEHVKISENALMTAAIMKAIRGLPTEEEQIRVLEQMLPIRTLAAHLGGRNIDVNPIFAELSKMSAQEPLSAANSLAAGPQTSAIQGPLSNLPRMRRLAPRPVGSNPVVEDNKQEEEPGKSLPQTQAPAPQKKTVMMRRRMTHGLKPDVSHQNNVDEETGSDASSVDESQTSEVSEDKPTFLSKIKAPFGKMFRKKEGGETAEPKKTEKREQARPKMKMNSKVKSVLVSIGLLVLIVFVIIVTLSTASAIGKNGVGPEFSQEQSPNIPAGADPETVLQEFQLNNVIDATEPMLKKPTWESMLNGTFAKDVPWNWIIWFAMLFAPLLMLVQDRFAEHEETDLRMVIPGLGFMLLMVFTSPLSSLLNFSGVDPTSMAVFRGFFEKLLVLMGVLVNIGMQWSASQSGKRDYSALAFAGLFASGALIYWWFPYLPAAVVIGWILMIGGIALQYYEVNVSGQGMSAVIVAFIMIAAFFFGFSVGVDIISEWSVKLYDISPVMALGLYKWRIIIATLVVSAPIAIGIGFLAGMILLRVEKSNGGSTEDSVASIAKLGEVVLYDAISLGIMIMYPLVSIIWYLVAVSAALKVF